MDRRINSKNFYFVKSRDRIGGTIRTDVFKLESDIYQAYSFYSQDKDEAIAGFGESDNDKIAIELSKQDLRKEWKAEYPNLL